MTHKDTSVLRVLIVDDERLARDGLRRHLERHDDVEIVGECANGRQAIEAIERLGPDLVLLDVQMPGLNGLDVVAQVGATRMPAVVFVTAHAEHALRAFQAHALDYLLKPIERKRLEAALQRARRRVESDRLASLGEKLSAVLAEMGSASSTGGGASQPSQVAQSAVAVESPAAGAATPDERLYAERFMVRIGERMHVVATPVIDWIEAQGDHVRLHVGARSYLLRMTLSAIEAQLSPRQFLRIHRSTVVNVDRVREVRPYPNRELIVLLADGTRLKLSRSYRDRFDALFGDAS